MKTMSAVPDELLEDAELGGLLRLLPPGFSIHRCLLTGGWLMKNVSGYSTGIRNDPADAIDEMIMDIHLAGKEPVD